MSALQAFLLFVGLPLLVYGVVALFVYAPSLSRGPKYRPGLSWWAEPVWISGGDSAAVATAEPIVEGVAAVPAGDAFSGRQLDSIERAIRQAEEFGGLDYSVYVGDTDGDPRERGRQLLGALGQEVARNHVAVVVDPGHRSLAILTGSRASLHLDDRATALAAMSMTSSFGAGDLAGGIVDGLRTLAEHARQPRALHTDVEN